MPSATLIPDQLAPINPVRPATVSTEGGDSSSPDATHSIITQDATLASKMSSDTESESGRSDSLPGQSTKPQPQLQAAPSQPPKGPSPLSSPLLSALPPRSPLPSPWQALSGVAAARSMWANTSRANATSAISQTNGTAMAQNVSATVTVLPTSNTYTSLSSGESGLTHEILLLVSAGVTAMIVIIIAICIGACSSEASARAREMSPEKKPKRTPDKGSAGGRPHSAPPDTPPPRQELHGASTPRALVDSFASSASEPTADGVPGRHVGDTVIGNALPADLGGRRRSGGVPARASPSEDSSSSDGALTELSSTPARHDEEESRTIDALRRRYEDALEKARVQRGATVEKGRYSATGRRDELSELVSERLSKVNDLEKASAAELHAMLEELLGSGKLSPAPDFMRAD